MQTTIHQFSLLLNNYPARGQRAALLAILICFLLFNGLMATQAQAAPKAADLVKDGQPINLEHEKYRTLFQELKSDHNFTNGEIEAIFTGQTINKRVLELMDRQWEAKPYYEYAPLFITPQIIATGKQKLVEHSEILDRIEQEIGVDREIIVAIWGIETRYGANQGSFNVLRTLITLFDAYPRRSSFFKKELVHFLLLCREGNVDPKNVTGSYAGAFGQTQFIPSSFRAYALSFDGDDRPDVWTSAPDILASIANYLKQFHWTLNAPIYWDLGYTLKDQQLIAANLQGRKGRVPWGAVRQSQAPDLPPSPGNRDLSIVGLELPPNSGFTLRYIAGFPNFQAITEWNHSNRYAMAVTELAEALKKP